MTRNLISILFAIFVFAPSGSRAEETRPPCEAEKIRFCADDFTPQNVARCLMRHESELSKSCKDELERLMRARRQAAARGGGALASFGGPNAIGPPVPIVSYEGRFSPGTQSTAIDENRLNVSRPIYQSADESIAISFAAGRLHFDDAPVLSTQIQLPESLYRFEFGGQYFHQLPRQKNWGLRTSIGYAGDKPFQTKDDLTYSLTAHYGFSASPKSSWVLTAFLSNNGPFSSFLPIPGILYIYRSEKLTGVFGFPILALNYSALDRLSLGFSAFGPNLQAQITYGSFDALQVFAMSNWTRQNFIPSSRPEKKDRLTFEEKKVGIGVRTPFLGPLVAELQAGRAFDRSFFIGKGLFNRAGGLSQISGDWYASWGVKALF